MPRDRRASRIPGMIAFIIRRIGQSVAVMLTVGFIAFALFNYIGDPLASMVGQDTSMVEREQLRHQLGLDDPFVVQFARFLVHAARGDFGISYQYARPVQQLLAERLPANARYFPNLEAQSCMLLRSPQTL